MVPLLYEVLLHVERPSVFGQRGRWYLASAHQDIAGAETSYRVLAAQFTDPAITLAVVRSEHDPASGLFRDRIVKASGHVPMIQRAGIERLDSTTRLALEREFPALPAIALPERPVAAVQARPLPWAWLGFVAATVGLFAAITVG